MVIREKKKLDMFKKASDVDAVPIIIEDSKSFTKNDNSGVKSSAANSSRFEVKPTKQATFQVRKKSVIQPVSETVVTRSWIEHAIRVFGDEESVVLLHMKFEKHQDSYHAHVRAEI